MGRVTRYEYADNLYLVSRCINPMAANCCLTRINKMHKKPDLNIFRSLLFVFDIDNPDNDSKTRQDILVSKNTNNTQELKELSTRC
ncbi:hypothetical protein PCL1606_58580 [Pseudomonas chlororaphis]|uniref:Uncharacterized protein n=1 Tax=Pseudomonas chlororaphis TaxID=587753 RepID=A0A0D5Y7J2_9PSED|nr:hypothetical protein PCL1606_58580 [Pseudomonas chlororaphis]